MTHSTSDIVLALASLIHRTYNVLTRSGPRCLYVEEPDDAFPRNIVSLDCVDPYQTQFTRLRVVRPRVN